MDIIRKANFVKFNFEGDELDVVKDGETLWISVKRVCEVLGIDRKSQQEKLKEKPWATTRVLTTLDVNRRNRMILMIDLDSLPMWLATIDTNRVSDGIQEKLETYQIEAAKALKDYFFTEKAVKIDPIAKLECENRMHTHRHKVLLECLDFMSKGTLFSPEYLRRKAEHSMAILSGEKVSDSRNRMIDVNSYLQKKELTAKEIRHCQSLFGKILKKLYVEKYDQEPGKCERFVNGADRLVNAYTENDSDLFDKTWDILLESRPLIAQRYEQRQLSQDYYD